MHFFPDIDLVLEEQKTSDMVRLIREKLNQLNNETDPASVNASKQQGTYDSSLNNPKSQ